MEITISDIVDSPFVGKVIADKVIKEITVINELKFVMLDDDVIYITYWGQPLDVVPLPTRASFYAFCEFYYWSDTYDKPVIDQTVRKPVNRKQAHKHFDSMLGKAISALGNKFDCYDFCRWLRVTELTPCERWEAGEYIMIYG